MFIPPAPVINGKIVAGKLPDTFARNMLRFGIISVSVGFGSTALLPLAHTITEVAIELMISAVGFGFGGGAILGWFATKPAHPRSP